jgi:anaerobic magnesium-protoporphyrin IX monomethyl ester cyclase
MRAASLVNAPEDRRARGGYDVPPGQSATGDHVDVLLVFPPQTEARFFPYLSLPYLAGHLRRRGRRVHQADLNIALLHDLLWNPGLLDEALRTTNDDGAGRWYRRAMADVAVGYIDQLRAHVLRKAPSGELGPTRSVRLAHHALELLVRDTFLTRTWRDLAELDEAAHRAARQPPTASGIPVGRLYRMVETLLARHRPRVVGLSVAFFSQLAPALLVAAWVRRLSPQTRICLGGQQVMIRHDDLARLPGLRAAVDALCWTAGEQPLERWLDALDGTVPPGSVPGMIWLSRSAPARRSVHPVTLRFHDVGPPDYAGLPVRSYLNETMEVAIISCVGCFWGRCAFCSYGNRSLASGAYQQGTARQIADAVEAVVRSTGAAFVAISDENTNLRLIVKAMREVRERGVTVRFGVRSRLDATLADPAFCRSLAEVGCAQMSIGYEGTSQRLLDLMDRGVRAADYQRIVENLAAAGIIPRLSVMGRVFDETPAEFEASMRFLVENEDKIGIDALELMVPEPGSRLATDPGAFGLTLDTSGALGGNPELSYLSGRVGPPLTVPGGPTRQEALDRLLHLFRSVRPGRASAVLPPRGTDGHRPRTAAAVRPHPWVRTMPPGGGAAEGADDRIVIVDLVWEQLYALPRRDVDQRANDLLAARTARGRRLLARLVDVAAAVDVTPPGAGAASGRRTAAAEHRVTPAIAGAEPVRRPT